MESWEAFYEEWKRVVPGADVWDRFDEAQSALARLTEVTLEAWRDVLPRLDGGDWEESLRAWSGRLRKQFVETPLGEAQELWPQYLDALKRFANPTDPVGRFVEAQLAPFLHAPAFGPAREVTDRQRAASEAWLELGKAATEFQSVVADTWVRALERFMRGLVERTAQSDAPVTPRAHLALLMETAEAVFVETYRTPRYIHAQTKFASATFAYRMRERELVDALAKGGHFPTRTEVDVAHRNVHELRAEVRALRSELRTLRDELHRAQARRLEEEAQ